jgi:hypothetical protein
MLETVINEYRDGHPPKSPTNAFRLASELGTPASSSEVISAWGQTELPPQVEDLWQSLGSARLFVDIDYGQWGLEILSPSASRSRTLVERAQRPRDVLPSDVVIGEFLGDQDLLVVDDVGRVLVAWPLDSRDAWPVVAGDLLTFLRHYWRTGGNKFWEDESLP